MSRPQVPGPWDAGLQPERTSLAWRRTCLTLAGVGLLVARAFLGTGSWGPLGLVVAIVGAGAGLVWWLAERRAHATVESLKDPDGTASRPGARLLLLLACCAGTVGLLNAVLTFVLSSR